MSNRKSKWSDQEYLKIQENQELSSKENQMSFDAFFQNLLKEGKVLKHHKLPMKKYFESQGIMNQASRDQLEQIWKTY
jgi:hypothetical protein